MLQIDQMHESRLILQMNSASMSRKFDFKKLAYVVLPPSPAPLTGLRTLDTILHKATGGKIPKWLGAYENFIGIKDVKAAQDRVTEVEKLFMETREGVKRAGIELDHVQEELQLVRTKLDRTPRDDPNFLEHATEEHKTIQTEKKLKETLQSKVDAERATFDILSAAVRESHTKQKAQEEKTKYLSIIGSILGTCIGILGSTLISQRRMKDLRSLISDLGERKGDMIFHGSEGEELQVTLKELQETISDSSTQTLERILTENLQKTGEILEAQQKSTEKLLSLQSANLSQEIKSIGQGLTTGPAGDLSSLEEMFGNTQKRLEWEVKMSALSTVVFIYGAFAITLPILYNIFK